MYDERSHIIGGTICRGYDLYGRRRVYVVRSRIIGVRFDMNIGVSIL